jgi:hypothetical protein
MIETEHLGVKDEAVNREHRERLQCDLASLTYSTRNHSTVA